MNKSKLRQSPSLWTELGQIGSTWQLLSFSGTEPPKWEHYWAEKREYWGADREDKSRVQAYFGETKTEENLLEKSKKGFASYKDYLLQWNGLCKIGDKVQVIPIDKNVIVLSKDWKGQVSDHSDLELWLKSEKRLLIKHVRYCCAIYSFGTVTVPPGSIPAQMGERVGSSRVSHRKDMASNIDPTVELIKDKHEITIGDAAFLILN